MWGIKTGGWTYPLKRWQRWFLEVYWAAQVFNFHAWDFWLTRGSYRSWGYSYYYYDGPIHSWGFWWFTVDFVPWQTRPKVWGWTEVEIATLLKEDYAADSVSD